MKQQTAVSQLIEQLRKLAHNPKTHLGMGDIRVTQGYLDELEEQAKLMEKEQIMNAFQESRLTHPMIGFKHKTFLEYYTQTYGMKTSETSRC